MIPPPKLLAELILELCGELHRLGNVPVLIEAPTSGGMGAVSVRGIEVADLLKDGPVVVLNDGGRR